MNERQTTPRFSVLLVACFSIVLSTSLMTSSAHGALIFSENFDNGNLPGSTQDPGAQFQTGLDLNALGDVLGWDESGHATVHAVDKDAGAGTDFAVMIWSGNTPGGENVITLTSGIAANGLGTLYAVDFESSPAVYRSGDQATTATDSLLVEILRTDDSVLATHNSFPGAWAGAMVFSNDGFTYLGDGTGVVRLRISSANPGNDLFAGAIDNLQVSTVPEPSSLALMALGTIGLAINARRKRRKQMITRD